MSDDVVRRLRQLGKQFHARDEEELDLCLDEEWHSVQTADETIEDAIAEIERLRDEHRAACEDRDAYRARYLKALAASVWKPGTKWKTYVNPQRSDGLFVATVGDLTRSYQAVPDRCLSLQCQLPHYDAEAVVRILNEWTESDARRAKEESDER